MTSEALVPASGKPKSDIFFGQAPIKTNWPDIIAQVQSGAITSKPCLQRLQALEPCTEYENQHTIYVLQQSLRLALRAEAGLTLRSEHTCAQCALNLADVALDGHCLECAEFDSQIGYFGSRGSCGYLRSACHVERKQWGILYYSSHGNQEFLFWLAAGWKSYHDAWLALYPIALYERYLRRVTHDLVYFSAYGFLDLSRIMPLALPLSPPQLECLLRSAIDEDMASTQEPLETAIHWALKDYDSKQRRQE